MSVKLFGNSSFNTLLGFDGSGNSKITPVANSIFLVRVDADINVFASAVSDNPSFAPSGGGWVGSVGNYTYSETMTSATHAWVSDLVINDSVDYNPVTGVSGIPLGLEGVRIPAISSPSGTVVLTDTESYLGLNYISASGLSFTVSPVGDGNFFTASDNGMEGGFNYQFNQVAYASILTVTPLAMFKSGW